MTVRSTRTASGSQPGAPHWRFRPCASRFFDAAFLVHRSHSKRAIPGNRRRPGGRSGDMPTTDRPSPRWMTPVDAVSSGPASSGKKPAFSAPAGSPTTAPFHILLPCRRWNSTRFIHGRRPAHMRWSQSHRHEGQFPNAVEVHRCCRVPAVRPGQPRASSRFAGRDRLQRSSSSSQGSFGAGFVSRTSAKLTGTWFRFRMRRANFLASACWSGLTLAWASGPIRDLFH